MSKKVEFNEKEYMEIYKIFQRITKPENLQNFKNFKKNLDKFIGLTFDAYIPNNGFKDQAFIKWIEFIGNEEFAHTYFKAVDKWSAYT